MLPDLGWWVSVAGASLGGFVVGYVVCLARLEREQAEWWWAQWHRPDDCGGHDDAGA